jgi:hypothetical protein
VCQPPQACCLFGNACQDLDVTTCLGGGGAPQGAGSTCATVSCTAAQACCMPDGTCADRRPAGCVANGGTPQGQGTACATANCPGPEACCMPDGSCTDSLATDCTAAGGSPRGAGTTCATENCAVALKPGYVPNGATRAGNPLRVVKAAAAGDLTLTWDTSCSASATDYAIYEGTIGTWYSHSGLACSTANALTFTVTPAAGSHYYVVVPLTTTDEGSYGMDSRGNERPVAATGACRPTQLLGCN